ncbi:MAG: sec-independent translocase [Aeromicrobium sp.]
MLGMGWPELLVIGIVAMLVFGPDRLPDIARQAGRFIRTVKLMAENAKDDLGREMGQDFSKLNLRDLDPREVVRRSLLEEDDAPVKKPSAQKPLTHGEAPPFDIEST